MKKIIKNHDPLKNYLKIKKLIPPGIELWTPRANDRYLLPSTDIVRSTMLGSTTLNKLFH